MQPAATSATQFLNLPSLSMQGVESERHRQREAGDEVPAVVPVAGPLVYPGRLANPPVEDEVAVRDVARESAELAYLPRRPTSRANAPPGALSDSVLFRMRRILLLS